jgi:hypothetical protein
MRRRTSSSNRKNFSRIARGNTATVYFKPEVPHELQFATHTMPATPRSHAFVE